VVGITLVGSGGNSGKKLLENFRRAGYWFEETVKKGAGSPGPGHDFAREKCHAREGSTKGKKGPANFLGFGDAFYRYSAFPGGG